MDVRLLSTPLPMTTNAVPFSFNNIDCNAMFKEVRQHLSAWIESCYAGQPLLHLGKDTILSCVGVQQGDPLGPLGFALTLHPIVKRIKAEVPTLNLNAWYLDDGTLCGPLLAALNIIESNGPSVGLHLNRNKSLLFISDSIDVSTSPFPTDILYPSNRPAFIL